MLKIKFLNIDFMLKCILSLQIYDNPIDKFRKTLTYLQRFWGVSYRLSPIEYLKFLLIFNN